MQSMTGYGRQQTVLGGRDIAVEIKSVNHRFLEVSVRTPRIYAFLEEKIKTALQKTLSRGKVDVNVTVYSLEAKESEVEINQNLAQGYVDALRQTGEALQLQDDLTLSTLTRFSDVFTVKKTVDNEEQVWADVKQVLDGALSSFVAMRAMEGERLKQDVRGRLDTIAGLVGQIETLAPQTVTRYRERLTARMQEILQDKNIDEQRILLEAALFGEKIAVDEETVRLRSHLKQFDSLLETKEAVGRKLDFMVQEMNRETNTIGSKAQDVAVTALVVEIKSEIEKIREQIQNIE